MKVIAIIGYTGAGKTTFAHQKQKELEKPNNKVYLLSFITPVREIIYNLLGYTPTDYADFKSKHVLESTENKLKFTGRELINNLTAQIFKQEPDFLRQILFRKLMAFKREEERNDYKITIIIDDLRTREDLSFLQIEESRRLFILDCFYVNYNKITSPATLAYYEELAFRLDELGYKHGHQLSSKEIYGLLK